MRKTRYSLLSLVTVTLSLLFLNASSDKAWSPTEEMLYERQMATAENLVTGDIIVTGGTQGIDPKDSEIFNRDKVWITAGGGTAAHCLSVNSLKSGKVLIAGYYQRASIFDPLLGNWGDTGLRPEKKSCEDSVVLSDGRVFFAGGQDENALSSDTANIYDPENDTWTSLGPWATLPEKDLLVSLPSGNIFVVSGAYDAPSEIMIFKPAENVWINASQMIVPTSVRHTALLKTGGIFAAGVTRQNDPDAWEVEIYNHERDIWQQILSYNINQYLPPILMTSGKLLFADGFNTPTVLFDSEKNIWESLGVPGADGCVPEGVTARALRPDGSVLFAGGAYDPLKDPQCAGASNKSFIYESGSPGWCKVCKRNGNCITMMEGLPCDDGDPATTTDHCDGKGSCVSTQWPSDGGSDIGPDAGDVDIDGGEADTGSVDVLGGESPDDAATHDAGQLDGNLKQDTNVEITVNAPGCGCTTVGL